MAAAANKPGAVHYALIFFVMVAVILGITTYMFHRDASDRFVELDKLKAENQNLNKLQRTLDDQIQASKNKIGIKLDLMDDPNNPQNQATVLAGLTSEIIANGKDVAGQTVVETLRKLREQDDANAADRDSKALKIISLEKEVLALKEQYQVQVDKYSAASKVSERDKLAVVADRDEKINAKTQENARLRTEVNTTKDELAQEKESRDKERKDLTAKITGLEIRIDALRAKIDDIEKLSFEVADGVIRRVEHATHMVWINLGAEDFLKTRMTFSVYGRENQSVGRGAEDIKGKIEVTRILGPHMAEARIIDEDLYRPIVSEDLIYTPIWSPGIIEKISIVGPIDLDNDGRSDREQFHQMMAIAGCVIDNEVDDNGDRVPADGKITVQTRFLVKSDIPDLAETSTEEEKAKVMKMMNQVNEMQNEARINGVRVIKLSDFLAYIGYHNNRRTFLAGQTRPYTLKMGASGADSSGISKDRASSGNVSKLYQKSNQAKQDTSDGATSKSAGNGK